MIKYTCAHCGKEIDIIGKGNVVIADGVVWHKQCFLDYQVWFKWFKARIELL